MPIIITPQDARNIIINCYVRNSQAFSRIDLAMDSREPSASDHVLAAEMTRYIAEMEKTK